MLINEFYDSLDRVGADTPRLKTNSVYEVAQAIYGAGDGQGGELVPDGQPGHDAVAKLIKKSPAMFLAIAQMREDIASRNITNAAELDGLTKEKQSLTRRVEQLELALVAAQAATQNVTDAMNDVKRKMFSAQNERDTYMRAMRDKESMLIVYRQLYGDAVRNVVKDAVTGKQLKDDLSSRCENERPKVEELQRLVV